jgi:hypothetical protein
MEPGLGARRRVELENRFVEIPVRQLIEICIATLRHAPSHQPENQTNPRDFHGVDYTRRGSG